jgi:serine/threonine-protein kinase
VLHEARVLRSLARRGVRVPEVYLKLAVGRNSYLSMEYIAGKNLQSMLLSRRRKIPIREALRLALQAAEIVSSIHASGWAWRDCKPLNFILDESGELRPIDFEGACRIGGPVQLPYGTAGYVPPEWNSSTTRNAVVAQDLYALGATLRQLVTSRAPTDGVSGTSGLFRRDLPSSVRRVIRALLDSSPTSRPTATSVAVALAEGLAEHQRTYHNGDGALVV